MVWVEIITDEMGYRTEMYIDGMKLKDVESISVNAETGSITMVNVRFYSTDVSVKISDNNIITGFTDNSKQ